MSNGLLTPRSYDVDQSVLENLSYIEQSQPSPVVDSIKLTQTHPRLSVTFINGITLEISKEVSLEELLRDIRETGLSLAQPDEDVGRAYADYWTVTGAWAQMLYEIGVDLHLMTEFPETGIFVDEIVRDGGVLRAHLHRPGQGRWVDFRLDMGEDPSGIPLDDWQYLLRDVPENNDG